jgi:hypothetical protein
VLIDIANNKRIEANCPNACDSTFGAIKEIGVTVTREIMATISKIAEAIISMTLKFFILFVPSLKKIF